MNEAKTSGGNGAVSVPYTDQECMEIEIEAMYSEVRRMRAEIERLRAAPIAALRAHPGFTEDEKRIAIEVVRAALESKP